MLLAVEGSQTGAAYSGWGLTSIVYSSRRVSVPVLLCLFTLQKCLSILQKCLQTCSVRTHSCFQPGGMTSQNDQNPMPFHPNTCYWAILFYSVSRLEQQSSPKVQSRNTWPFCDYWADHTPSRFFFCFCFGQPPLSVWPTSSVCYIYPLGGLACTLLGSNRQRVVEQTTLPVNACPSTSRWQTLLVHLYVTRAVL